MIDLNIWFVTISHRPSLIRYHTKELKLYLPHTLQKDQDLSLNNDREVSLDLTTDPDSTSTRTEETMIDDRPLTNSSINTNAVDYVEIKESNKWLKEIRDVWKLIHIPFGANDRTLRMQVNAHTYIAFLHFLPRAMLVQVRICIDNDDVIAFCTQLPFLFTRWPVDTRVYHVVAVTLMTAYRDHFSDSEWDWRIDQQERPFSLTLISVSKRERFHRWALNEHFERESAWTDRC